MKKSKDASPTIGINATDQAGDFPKYLMKINGQRQLMTFRQAYVAYDSGLVKVEFGRYVVEANWCVRRMTKEDMEKISRAADEYSASK